MGQRRQHRGDLALAAGLLRLYPLWQQGQVLQSAGRSRARRPTVASSPATVTRGSSYQVSGTQFNGLSQANSFGDEDNSPTNYPLVRITNNASGHVFYARTHDHSTMGVATGSAIVSTNFDVPGNMETGLADLVVVANGIPSLALVVNGPVLTLPGPLSLTTCAGTPVTGTMTVRNTG